MFRKPDLHAPRFRPKVLSLMNQSLFEKFKQKFPGVDLSYEQFEQIIETYNGNTWMTAVQTRDGAELPEGMGTIFVGSCKKPRKRKNVDFKKSAELGTTVSHRNWDSNNRLAKIFYTNARQGSKYGTKRPFRGRELWGFVAVRQFSRTVAQVFPKQWQIYAPVENIRKISQLFQMSLRRDIAKKVHQNFDYNSYNEFDLT